MSATENQSIILYAPRSNIIGGALIGIICLSIGVALPFLAGRQPPIFLLSPFFVLGGIWFVLIFLWKLLRNPILSIDSQGISSRHPFSRTQIKWEEIDSIYQINNGAAFAVDLSPVGFVSFFSRRDGRIPQHLDLTTPHQAFVVQGINLSLPVDQLLAQIRERFSDQLERYNIYLNDGHEENQKPE
ncbi:MAG TPA: hypothetical protein VFV38_15250 [Ktedonobacteraceae bacterium]|nr:hypothetical protein [Ktedonobacteraceae bacterium]